MRELVLFNSLQKSLGLVDVHSEHKMTKKVILNVDSE